MNRIMATWRNGKMNDHPVYKIPNHQPTKMDVFPRTLVQIIIVAKWLVQHSPIRPPTNSNDLAFSSVSILPL